MFWNRNKKEKAAAGNEKNRFDHLLSVAEKLPVEGSVPAEGEMTP